jgi:hypothetical protein
MAHVRFVMIRREQTPARTRRSFAAGGHSPMGAHRWVPGCRAQIEQRLGRIVQRRSGAPRHRLRCPRAGLSRRSPAPSAGGLPYLGLALDSRPEKPAREPSRRCSFRRHAAALLRRGSRVTTRRPGARPQPGAETARRSRVLRPPLAPSERRWRSPAQQRIRGSAPGRSELRGVGYPAGHKRNDTHSSRARLHTAPRAHKTRATYQT